MAKAAADRYTTAGDMAREIRDLLQGNVGRPAPRTRPAEPPRESARGAARVQRRHLSFLAVSWEAAAHGRRGGRRRSGRADAAFKRRCTEIVARYSGTILQRRQPHARGLLRVPDRAGGRGAPRRPCRPSTFASCCARGRRTEARRACWLSVHTGTVVVRQTDDGKVEVYRRRRSPSSSGSTRSTEPGDVYVTRDAWRLVSGHFEAEDGRQPPACAAPGSRSTLFRVVQAVTGFRPFESEGVALTPLIGRDQEMGLLFDRWNQTREGRGPGGDADRRRRARQVAARPRAARARHRRRQSADRRMALLAVSHELRALSGHRLLGADASASLPATRRGSSSSG